MIETLVITVGIFVLGEMLAVPLFRWIRRRFGPGLTGDSRGARVALAKGLLERLFLVIGMMMGYPVVIVALGALKLGTRLKEDQESKISNDYFLIGNLCSLLLALLYVLAAGRLADSWFSG